jgi:hypothetical protein
MVNGAVALVVPNNWAMLRAEDAFLVRLAPVATGKKLIHAWRIDLCDVLESAPVKDYP